jgi:predicted lipoprotein with Yx(FWY)xxD motif
MRTTRGSNASAARLVAVAAAMTALVAIGLAYAPATRAAARPATIVSTTKTSLGQLLVNSSGRTLYLFAKDRNGKSLCSGQCASFWPPLLATGKPSVSGAAKASLLGTVKRADGRLQLTYNHHPLYMFSKDTKKGQTGGEELKAFGAEWYVVSPGGTKIEKSSSTGGYNP